MQEQSHLHADVHHNTCFVFKGPLNWLNPLYLCYYHKGVFFSGKKKNHYCVCTVCRSLSQMRFGGVNYACRTSALWIEKLSGLFESGSLLWIGDAFTHENVVSFTSLFLSLSLSFSLNWRYSIFRVWFVCSLLSSWTN